MSLIPEKLANKIDWYAELLVKRGVNLQPGQKLIVSSPVECAEFTRLVVKKAYEVGAGRVHVDWSDTEIARQTYSNCPVSEFEEYPSWSALFKNELAEKGAAYLALDSEDPDWASDIDPKKFQVGSIAAHKACGIFREKMDFGHMRWCIAGVPCSKWARKIYPKVFENDGEEAAIEKLWNTILSTARVEEGGFDDWIEHESTFEDKKETLNELKIKELHYSNSKGTDFKIELSERAIWHGGTATSSDGIMFAPNIPTEEVYTSPDFRTANGVVHAAMPLVRNGSVIRDFWIRFENGNAVEWAAAENEDVLTSIIETDEGSHRLGEVALVPYTSPIRQSGVLFYDTLYDENASCHLALGLSFAECLDGGLDMDKEGLLEAGMNDSVTHVDFMIGTEDMNIEATTYDGEVLKIFENGEWAV